MDNKQAVPMIVEVYGKVIRKDGRVEDLGMIYTDSKGWTGFKIWIKGRWRRTLWSLRKVFRL